MAEETAIENGKISNFQGTLILTLDRVILHTVVHHSSTSTYMPNFIEIEETSCGRKDIRTYVRAYGRTDGHLRPTLLGRQSTQKSRPKNEGLLKVTGSHVYIYIL